MATVKAGWNPCRCQFHLSQGEQKPSLVFESLQAARCDVVFDSGELGVFGLYSGVLEGIPFETFNTPGSGVSPFRARVENGCTFGIMDVGGGRPASRLVYDPSDGRVAPA